MQRVRDILRGATRDRGLVAALVVWNPLITLGFDLTFGGAHDLGRRLAISLVIADVTALLCFGAVLGGAKLEAHVRRRRGEPPKARSTAFWFGASALLMPLALPVGLAAGARCASLLGAPERAPGLHDYRVGLGFGVIATTTFFLLRARREAREAAAAAEARIRDLENANLRAQLAALTAEMNPHMLFNALNTIASLVHDDPDRAEETVVELAELYRGILRSSGAATHALSDEIRLCEAYLRVERARFGERLEVEIDVDGRVDARAVRIPVLLLQPLVENAVKHGISPRASGGKVAVRVAHDGGRIVAAVEDDGVGVGASPSKGTGRALANCHDRLRLAYGDAAALAVLPRTSGGTRAELSLPPAPLVGAPVLAP